MKADEAVVRCEIVSRTEWVYMLVCGCMSMMTDAHALVQDLEVMMMMVGKEREEKGEMIGAEAAVEITGKVGWS